MNRAAPVDLRKSLEIANHGAHRDSLCADPGGDRRRIPDAGRRAIATASEWQSKPRRMMAVQHEGTNHPVAIATFFITGVHLQPN